MHRQNRHQAILEPLERGWAQPTNSHTRIEATAAAAVDKVLDALRKADLSTGDEIIFRDTAFSSLPELRTVMARAPY